MGNVEFLGGTSGPLFNNVHNGDYLRVSLPGGVGDVLTGAEIAAADYGNLPDFLRHRIHSFLF